MKYPHVTVCFSLPRSRSQWLAWLYGLAATSWHDPLKQCRSPQDLKQMIDQHTSGPLFIADTSAILFHQAVTSMLPGATFLYVLRPLPEVVESIYRQHLDPPEKLLRSMLERLEHEAAKAPWSRSCKYREIELFARLHWPTATWSNDLGNSKWKAACAEHVDVPLARQKSSPQNLAALMQHKEIP